MADFALIYFAQNASYLGPISGTNPNPVTAAVGFNENATLPFQVMSSFIRTGMVANGRPIARKDLPFACR